MASSIVKYCYLLSRCSTSTRSIAEREKLNWICYTHNALSRHCIHQTTGFRNREIDSKQGTEVHIPIVSTKAEVRFNVQHADWIPEDVRRKILEKNRSRINKAGELFVTSELSRSQQRNLGDCVQKIADIIADASQKPHQPTAEDVALRAARLEKRNQERLRQKKRNSATKGNRRVDFD